MRYVEAGSEQLPFDTAHFDIVTTFNSLDHVEDVGAAVAEAQRVLAPGGTLLLIVEVGHKATLTEPHSLDETIAACFSQVNEVSREVFGVRDDHNLYGSISERKVRQKPTDPGILCIRFEKPVASTGKSYAQNLVKANTSTETQGLQCL